MKKEAKEKETKVYRVNTGCGESHLVEATKMETAPDSLTFKDANGDVVGLFRGYGLSVTQEGCGERQPKEISAFDLI